MTESTGGAALEAVETNLDAAEWSAREPHTTLILACYRVRRYLPHFLASLDAQTADHRGYEAIFVVDGCPEHSEEVVREWAARTDYAVRIVVKPNGGVASARNVGLRFARGDWISAPDPDDWLDPAYLAEVERARTEFPGVAMLAARVALMDPEGRPLVHPLEYRFDRERTHLIDLEAEPDRIQTLGGTVFVSREVVERHGIRFDERLVQASDTDFVARFLLRAGAEYVLVPEARYEYRRRADGSSIVARQASNDLRYRVIFGKTHRALLELAGPECPQWLANTLLYFCQWPFMRARRPEASSDSLRQSELDEITDALRENLRRMGAARIEAFRVVDLPLDVRAAWLAAANGRLESSPVELLEVSEVRDLRRIAFASSRPEPPAGLRVVGAGGDAEACGDAPAEILETKSRRIVYLGTTWAFQHIVLLAPAGAERAALASDDGFEFRLGGVALPAAEIREQLGQRRPALPEPRPAPPERRPTPARPPSRLAARATGVRARLGRLRLSAALRLSALTGRSVRFRAAWVFDGGPGAGSAMLRRLFDEAGGAEDRGGAPRWYVADGDSDEYHRLRRAGAPVAARGSARHFLLLKHARLLLSPSLERSVRTPFPPDVLAKTWRFVYLPADPPSAHAYRVLNGAPIDAIGAADEAERAVLADDGGDYRFTRSEVLLLPGYRDGGARVNAGELARLLAVYAG